jgi:hypothetical protein
MHRPPLIGDGYFFEQLVVFTADLLRKSTPEGFKPTSDEGARRAMPLRKRLPIARSQAQI